MNKNRWLSTSAISLAIASSLLLTACNDENQAAGQQRPPQHVKVIVAEPTSYEVTTSLPARTSAYRIAEIRPQVGGIILKREFQEGQNVKAGQSLYQIDPATYQAAYNKAKADLASAEANAKIASLTVNRYKPLLNTKSISRQDYDEAVAKAAQADASVQIAQAALDSAEINLNYTKVYSPIEGRIGKSSVTEGALVSASQATALAVVQEIDPIYVDMSQSLSELLKLQASNIIKQEGQSKVTLILDNGQPYPIDGTLEFKDITVSETTGTVSLRAVFPNPKGELLPGMFVRTTLYEGMQDNVYLIPQQAVSRNAKGETSVKVVNKDDTIATKVVEAKEAVGSNWLVTSGLENGDKIVVSGLQKINDGAKVSPEVVKSADSESASESQPKQAQ